MNAIIRSVGTWLPDYIATNDDLSKIVDTNDEWVRSRSGIEQRHIVKDDSLKTSDIGAFAAQDALKRAGVDPLEIDGIIAGSMSPDHVFPAVAVLIQKALGCKNAWAYDLTAACGFIPFAISNASNMIRTGQARNILVVGAEICSRILDWTDRNTCVLFGDAAGAILVSACDDPKRGFLDSVLKSDGNLDHILYLNQSGHEDHFLRMDGKAVFKLAVTELAATTKATLAKAGYTTDDLDLLVPHQANIRILQATAERMGIPLEKVIVNVQRYGNTSSASVPIALREALDQGRIKEGDLVALVAIGGGMSWGCNLLRW